jgi:hypothetical protein
MKNIKFFPILFIGIASLFFFSCSKEKFTLSNSGANETISTSKMVPIYNYGGISGTLTPVPYYAALKIYNDEQNFGTYCLPDPSGNFKITTLFPGIYRIIVIYIPEKSPTGESMYFEIPRIVVEPGVVTELGEIKLPE